MSKALAGAVAIGAVIVALGWGSGSVSAQDATAVVKDRQATMKAQGAAMAIEDGYVLARCLERYASDPEHALQVYQSLRIQRTTRIVRGSAANLQRFHNPLLATPGAAEAYVDQEWSAERVNERYEWVFSYDVDKVPV